MKKLITFSIFCFFLLVLPAHSIASESSAQTLSLPALKTGWSRVNIENVGSIDLPQTIPVLEKTPKNLSINKSQNLTVQQFRAGQVGRGEKFASVVLVTEIFGKQLDFNIHELTKLDIAELDMGFKHQQQQHAVRRGYKINKWQQLSIEKVNGISCIHINYTMQHLDDNFTLNYHQYVFPINDRTHTLSLSYRLSDSGYWKDDFVDILNSFTIINHGR